jgi:hypothetical protein
MEETMTTYDRFPKVSFSLGAADGPPLLPSSTSIADTGGDMARGLGA